MRKKEATNFFEEKENLCNQDKTNTEPHITLYKDKRHPSVRRHSQVEVIPKRKAVPCSDLNTYEIHEPPTKETLNNSVFLIPEMPAPPSSAMSVFSPITSSDSQYHQKPIISNSGAIVSNVATKGSYKTNEIHKNISAVVRQLSKYITKNHRHNEILPLDTTSADDVNDDINIPSKNNLSITDNYLPPISNNRSELIVHRNMSDNRSDSINNKNSLDLNKNRLSKQHDADHLKCSSSPKSKQNEQHSFYVQEWTMETKSRY